MPDIETWFFNERPTPKGNEMAKIDTIYIGSRDAMITEVAAMDLRGCGVSDKNCEFLVMPTGDNQWDTEGFPNKSEAEIYARELHDCYGGQICLVA
jgi:hypothetical protein